MLAAGLSHLARLVYYEAIRPYMDYGTGVVGIARGISYQSIAEALYVEPVRGRHASGAPTKKAVRVAVDALVAAGILVRMDHPTRRDALVFRCVFAVTDQSVQNMRGTSGAHEGHGISGTSGAPASSRKERKKRKSFDDEGQGQKNPTTSMRGTPPVSGIPEDKSVLKNTVEFAASRSLDLCENSSLLPSPAGSPTGIPSHGIDQTTKVFNHWRQVMGKPRAKFDAKRKRAVAARLKDGYSVADLCMAIDGCKASPWHQGGNDRKTIYDDLELICRTAANVDRFTSIRAIERRNAAEVDEFVNGYDYNTIEGEFKYA